MKLKTVPLLGVLLVAASIPGATAQNQTNTSEPTVVDYKPGQVWTMNQSITVTILAIGIFIKSGRSFTSESTRSPRKDVGTFS